MKELLKGGTALADPSWEERHPTTFIYMKSDSIRWLEGRAKERARRKETPSVASSKESGPQ